VFDAAAALVTCELSMPTAVRFVKAKNNATAGARAILKLMAGMGLLRSVLCVPLRQQSWRAKNRQ
jgi:hypothetical protein